LCNVPLARIFRRMGLFDRYELVRLLGRGGAGSVYLARDRLLAGREVALKSITARVDDVIRAAFEREFAMLTALRVPGVSPVYDFGVRQLRADQPALPFFTRGYVAGEPLDSAVSGRSLTERVRLLLRAASVIAPLHDIGVTHGDIKPGNIIVDASDQPWLIDFGLARARTFEHSHESHAPTGTPSFMSPELLRGGAPNVAADVYALGVTLWLLVTGHFPFAELGARANVAKMDGQLPQIPDSTDSQVRALCEVAQRALAPRVEDRFPCVAELQASLERVVSVSVEQARAFVLPRPRGHEQPLLQLEAALMSDRKERAVVVQAPSGGGKSLLLRELKWRRQLASQLVLEVTIGDASGVMPLVGLFEQLEIVLGPEHAASAAARAVIAGLRSGNLQEMAAADSLSQSLQAVAADTPLALFIDDLDRADALFGAMLRSAIHAVASDSVTVVATATDVTAPAVAELQADTKIALQPLSDEDVAALCTEALGALDQSVITALVQYSQGLPGVLASAFYRLHALAAVTADDVAQLPAAEATLTLTHARLARVPASDRRLLQALALVATLPLREALALMSGSGEERAASLGRLTSEGVLHTLSTPDTQVALADGGMRRGILATMSEEERSALASELLHQDGISQVDRAGLAVAAHDTAAMSSLIPAAVESLTRIGAQARAAGLLEALLTCAHGEQRVSATLQLSSIRHALAQDEAAAGLATALAEDPCTDERHKTKAYLLAARALTALGRWDDAIGALGRVPGSIDGAEQAQVQRELAKIHLRRGDYDAVASAVKAGLASATEDDPVRVELLCSCGIVANYSGDQSAARDCYEQALALARSKGVRSDEANVLSYLAIGTYRAGDMLAARDLFAQSLEIARDLGDVGSMATSSLNLGAVFYNLGEPETAAEHYASAARLARRAGRKNTRLFARVNLTHLHVYFGLYESARAEISELRSEAEAAGQRATVAQLTAFAAELSARTGEVDRALIGFDDAIARYSALGRTREVIDYSLKAAEALLDRGGPADASAAAPYLARAREHLAREQADDLRQRLDLLVARARLESGEPDAAVRGLEDVVTRARATRSRDVEWPALAALALAQERCGAVFAAKHSARAAVEVLEDIVVRVPREHRDAFWQDPRRRAVREYANKSEHLRPSSHVTLHGSDSTALRQERDRLFQILRRLASEQDPARLLERIIESAVDLSGAEHGSVLLVDEKGQLSPQMTHARPALADQGHETFSRSIAEAVLIDGEPIVTVDALADGRLSSYVSVHKLMLRSVACLPIRGHAATLGVLYLEHRRSRGRFSEEAVELLSAFADQAAIALENARMLREIRRQKDELEQANQELQQAKGQLEELLLTRTRQLDDVQRELANVMQRDVQSPRHGMVGKSLGMHRLLDGITRVAGSSVPVVICGETGTGKELVARAIHESSTRAAGPFVTLNCGSVPETLLESELFGYVKGAFSGADRDRKGLIAGASGGTLFLDEVSEMSPKMQASLLRVLQERKVTRVGSDIEESIDVRVLASTRKPLSELVASGQFREDLLYRISVVELNVPPLRDRREDIPLLCDHLLREFASRESVPRCHLTRAALAMLMDQPWPGNVRQLAHVLLQACVMAESTTLQVTDLALGDSVPPPPSQLPRSDRSSAIPSATVESLSHHKLEEKQRILHALEAAGWNRVKAAQALGMPRRTFYRRLTDYSIL